MLVTKQLTVVIDLHSMQKNGTYGSQWLPSTVWLLTFFNIFFKLIRREKTHLGLKQVDDE